MGSESTFPDDMKVLNKNQKKLATYLTVGLGSGCLAGQADAAVIVTFYGPGAQNPGTTPATPAGIAVGSFLTSGNRYIVDSNLALAAFSNTGANYFTSGTNLNGASGTTYGFGQYIQNAFPVNGVTLNSNQNYANLSFNGPDNTYEAVAQFFLNGSGTGYLVAIARNDNNSALGIAAGKLAIDSVPEPSGLALLALGAGGLIARRRRQAA